MKYTLLLLALCLLNISAFRQKNTRIVFFGDSITELAVKPDGYITQLRDSLPTTEYELLGAGVSADKVYDLYLRLENDVLDKQPDQVFIFVGVNDVWHKRLLGTGTDLHKFKRFYAAIIEKIQEKGAALVLCTPACIGEKTDCTNALDGELNQYAQVIRELAKQYNCGLCDLRQAFLDYNLKHNVDNLEKGVLTTDRVHLNLEGNRLVTELMLEHIR